MADQNCPRESGWSVAATTSVLTYTAKIWLNPTFAATFDDDNNTVVTTVDAATDGSLLITVTVTPDTPVTTPPAQDCYIVRDTHNPSYA